MTEQAGVAPKDILMLSPDDNIAVAVRPLYAGQIVEINGDSLTLLQDAQLGAKIAVRPIVIGETIRKYGAPIGSATQNIQPGEHVHTHNLKSNYLKTYARGEAYESIARKG